MMILSVGETIACMASETRRAATGDGEYAQRFPNWVYQVPGILLIVGGFGGLAFMALT